MIRMVPGNHDRAVETNNRVLIVDDQQDIHQDFREILTPETRHAADGLAEAFSKEAPQPSLPAFELQHAYSGEEACALVASANADGKPFAVSYVDIRMQPGMDGVDTIHEIRKIDRDIELVVMTAHSEKSLRDIVQDMAPLHKLLYVRKPFTGEEIQQMTTALVEKYNVSERLAAQEREVSASNRRLQAILDATGDAIALFNLNRRLAFANRRYEELCGAAEGELSEMPLSDATPRLRAAELPHGASEPPFESDEDLYELVSEPGGRLFRRSETQVTSDDGKLIGRLHIYRDVSKDVQNRRMRAEVQRLRSELEATYSFSGIVGASPAMREVFALMERAAESDLPVLILGESGTGKELVAKALHFNGPRRSEPFVAVNCAALPEMLIESELFGHERGAFTGAHQRRRGAFERAAGGTILLDEIGDMEPSLQGKLLRVLQEREIQRLGADATLAVDVRVITATNQNLEEAMRAGRFRDDLYYRVATIPIKIPPLRERREDIPLLAAHFLEKQTKDSDRTITGISDAALRAMYGHDWPGNVRELENAIGRAILMEPSDTLSEASLQPLGKDAPGVAEMTEQEAPESPIMTLKELERRAVTQALKDSNQNISQAAKLLGIDRTTLHRKLRSMDSVR